MRLLIALLLVASVLHTQLAVGCHCHHEGQEAATHVGCQHDEFFGEHADHDHPLPAPTPCDGCAECEKGDPVGLRIEASPELGVASLLTVWTAPPVELLSTTVRHSQHQQSAPPDGARSLLACGTLLRI
jgi:hypothetical protein